MNRAIWAVALTLFAFDAAAQSVSEPWKWRLEDRISARTSADARKARLKEAGRPPASAPGLEPIDIIDGKVHPELFVPVELLEALVSLHVLKPDWLRDEIAARSDDLFRTKHDRAKLEALIELYAAAMRQERHLLDAGSNAELPAIRKEKRKAEATALRNLRAAFGKERFDRFLYTVIAPTRRKVVGRGDRSILVLEERERAAR
jgi:hypothetical protein